MAPKSGLFLRSRAGGPGKSEEKPLLLGIGVGTVCSQPQPLPASPARLGPGQQGENRPPQGSSEPETLGLCQRSPEQQSGANITTCPETQSQRCCPSWVACEEEDRGCGQERDSTPPLQSARLCCWTRTQGTSVSSTRCSLGSGVGWGGALTLEFQPPPSTPATRSAPWSLQEGSVTPSPLSVLI